MMTMRASCGTMLVGLALALASCATTTTPLQPPLVVATLPPPPPQMPSGGYVGMKSPTKRADGTYFTPNLDNTDQAAVWHLRNALNVAALGCDLEGGGVIEPYNAWLRTRAAAIDRYYQAYIREWQATGWWDWQRVYDNNQTRIYNFYAQPAMRSAFCAAARREIMQVGQVEEGDLPTFARAALLRIDRVFVEFFAAFDAWRDYYEPKPPTVVRTIDIPASVPPPVLVVTPEDDDTTTVDAVTSPVNAPAAGSIARLPTP